MVPSVTLMLEPSGKSSMRLKSLVGSHEAEREGDTGLPGIVMVVYPLGPGWTRRKSTSESSYRCSFSLLSDVWFMCRESACMSHCRVFTNPGPHPSSCFSVQLLRMFRAGISDSPGTMLEHAPRSPHPGTTVRTVCLPKSDNAGRFQYNIFNDPCALQSQGASRKHA